MLTAFQIERIAYAPEEWYGEFTCRSCAVKQYEAEMAESFDEPDTWAEDDEWFESIGLRAWDRYSVEETAQGLGEMETEGHVDCGCTEGIYCVDCGAEIVEPYTDEYTHREDEEDES